jgi:hypothetical protein
MGRACCMEGRDEKFTQNVKSENLNRRIILEDAGKNGRTKLYGILEKQDIKSVDRIHIPQDRDH